MATLVSKDTSGIYVAGEGEAEVTARRTRSFKVFHRGGRSHRVAGQIGPIHYRLDPFNEAEPLSEIDLDLIASDDSDYDWMNLTNGYQVHFRSALRVGLVRWHRFIARYRRAGGWLRMRPLALIYENADGQRQLVSLPQNVTIPEIDDEAGTIIWRDGFGAGLDFGYRRMPDRFEKFLTIQNSSALPAPTIDTTGLQLIIVMAMAWIPGFFASDGFAAGITTDDTLDFDYTDLDAVDEDVESPARFSFRDGLDRDCWWMQDPAGRDGNGEPIPMSWSLRRRAGRVIGRFSVEYATLQAASYPVFIDTTMTEELVSASEDDAWQWAMTYPGDDNFQDTTIYVMTGHGSGSGQSYRMVGLRFTPPIPAGASVDYAEIGLFSLDGTGQSVDLLVYCEDTDDAGSFVATTHEPDDVYDARTTAYGTFQAGGVWEDIGTLDVSQDLSAPVQEVVDRPGWTQSSGMAFVMVWNPSGTYGSKNYRSYDFGAGSEPRLNVDYTEAGAPSSWVMVIKSDE